MTDILIIVAIVIVALLAIGMILARLYTRASKEVAFVRTGAGGQKVVMDGGAIVLPVLHEVVKVNMRTFRLEVSRVDDHALITKDRLRVDVTVELYGRVKPTLESIATAAQTLGSRTMNPNELRDTVEGKFVGALRSVAAQMSMEQLHEHRNEFVSQVQAAVAEDLLMNGLELEAVSLTGLDQTSREFFKTDNLFDAEGLTILTETVEDRRKRRNEIERNTEVAIETKNLEAEQQQLTIARDKEYARLAQQREISIRSAEQKAEIAGQESLRKREAEEARILADQQIRQAEITSEQAVAEQRIAMEQQVRDREIAREKAVETADIDRRKSIELSDQDRSIAVAEKSKQLSEAKAAADAARALAVRAEEQIATARETEVAERGKVVALVEARKQAERQAISVVVAAEAEKQAADDHAEAVKTLAQGEADKARIAAEGDADADKLRAAGSEARYKVDATGKRALNEAANALSPEQIAMQLRLALIQALPQIIAESVKPMERIDGIKIFQVDGLGGGGAPGGGDAGGGSLADQVVNSALRYRGQAPLLDALLKEIGIVGGEVTGFTSGLQAAEVKAAEPKPAAKAPSAAVRPAARPAKGGDEG